MIIRLKPKNFNMMLIEKLQQLSALLSRNIDKYTYLRGEKIFPYNQKQIIEEGKFSEKKQKN